MNALLESLAVQTEEWIRAQRQHHLAQARPLSSDERGALQRHVSVGLLDRARIAITSGISNPPFLAGAIAALRSYGIQTGFDFRTAAGITFDDCILVREGALSAPLLLHELVHVEQYRRLGIPGFARGYVFGLANAGFVYEANSFEAIAFHLDARFRAGHAFDLTSEVSTWLAQQKLA